MVAAVGIVLVRLGVRQRIGPGLKAVHRVIGIGRPAALRIGDGEEVAVRVVGRRGRFVERTIKATGRLLTRVMSAPDRLPAEGVDHEIETDANQQEAYADNSDRFERLEPREHLGPVEQPLPVKPTTIPLH